MNLYDFIKHETGYEGILNDNVTINIDIGIDGDDAINFMSQYSKIFGVDISEFNYHSHFSKEGFSLILFFKNSFSRPKPFYIKQLQEGIVNKKLA